VADVVEAVASHRPYRAAPGLEAALREIQKGSGTLYNPVAVKSCVRLFNETGFQLLPQQS
jgi:HD-GYP domain-containing protein (c-di-GMP phosphodiesterase class II)